ncbi:MAG TPA: glycosyltransferase family 2 protein [Geminicoccaceae bacterium]
MPDPILSVVIPAYNVERYIEAAVRSALGQTLREIEVLVVDDGSTDATPLLLARLERELRDPRLRIIRKVNGGLSAARNTGIRAARGALIGFLDGDDLWRPEKAERHVARMDRDRRLGVTFSHSEYLTDDGRPTGRLHVSRLRRPGLGQMIRRNHVGNGSSPVVRRECFAQAGLFDEGLRSCEDYEMWVRILGTTRHAIGRIPEPLTLYRLRDSSLSTAFEGFLASADQAVATLRERLPAMPERVFREGHAVHYRIASRKAVSLGQRLLAIRYFGRALAICPWLFLIDPRAVATALLILSAGRGEGLLYAVQGCATRWWRARLAASQA